MSADEIAKLKAEIAKLRDLYHETEEYWAGARKRIAELMEENARLKKAILDGDVP